MLDGRRTKWTLAALMLAVGVWAAGCEDTPVIAPSDGEVRVVASPKTIEIDEEAGETGGTSTIAAQVFDADGRPLKGVTVFFTTDFGTMASGGPPNTISTDSNGIAVDELTVPLTSGTPESVEVSATSGKLTGSETVAISILGANRPPTADLVISPTGSQGKNRTVTFSGQSSTDPDGDLITCYQFRIVSSAGGGEQVETRVSSTFSRQFASEQTLDVTLLVSDDPTASSWCRNSANPPPATNFSPNTDTVAGYRIVCDTTGPSVDILTGNQTLPSSGGTVTLRGQASDAESGITSYFWDCGNGTTQPGSGSTVQNQDCVYPAGARGYTATLTVTNGCGTTAQDAITVTVPAP